MFNSYKLEHIFEWFKVKTSSLRLVSEDWKKSRLAIKYKILY